IYVNGGGPAPAPGEHFGPGTIVLITPNGAVRQVAEDIAFANGMAVSPDNRTLIVAESHARRLTAFDIAEDGGLSKRRVWVREGSAKIDKVEVDRGCFACMLGGAGGRTLFIVAAEWRGFENMVSDARTGQVLSAAVSSPGAGWPSYDSGTRW
ncbi:MAG: SMP-30/gluconolactonase/LRE family protein, partial [Mesorhizobium sp.]